MAETKTTKAKEAFSVFIPSKDRETITKEGKKFIYGFVNGDRFEVPCDEQVEVTEEVFNALQGVLELIKQGK